MEPLSQYSTRGLGFSNLLCRSEEELAELKGTQLLNSTLGYKDYVQSEFLKVQEEIIDPNRHLFDSDITQKDFLWAFGILRSRAFPPFIGDNLAMVPFADLVNHGFSINVEEPSWERKVTGLFDRQEALTMRAPAAFRTGEQVLMQYGMNKSNGQLALDYGFVERNRKNGSNRDIFTLTLEISESDPFFADKLDIAELNGMETTAYFDITQGQGVPESMLTFLRLIALGGTDAFLLEPLFRDSVWEHLSLPVSQENEAAICKVVLDGCQSTLSGYGTTIEEDEALLGRKLDARLEIAAVTRLGEKQVLQEIQKSFEEYIVNRDQLEYYQERRLKNLGLMGEIGEIIFWEPK
uniref:Rubisco LSMT substrate-binding domain-containing protein n=1 Tax=Picea sitchensis TaxID=3332 RepID=B8LNW5_PICSI|nr:unknown [Picea sitchensis]